jgi:hypothetical protein
MIALLKYGTGIPFKRLEKLESQLAMPLPAATQWELVATAAKVIWPALEELIRRAAQGSIMHNDDTSMRILRITREADNTRRGIFTSGVVSIVGAYQVALFFTGTKHTGENIAEVPEAKARKLPAPIQMCDALSRNSRKRLALGRYSPTVSLMGEGSSWRWPKLVSSLLICPLSTDLPAVPLRLAEGS